MSFASQANRFLLKVPEKAADEPCMRSSGGSVVACDEEASAARDTAEQASEHEDGNNRRLLALIIEDAPADVDLMLHTLRQFRCRG